MRIAIIGAGFTGLSAAYQLAKLNHEVVVLEKDAYPGGLAVGYKEKEWDWTLEKHYHHWFTNDNSVLSLAKEIGHEVLTKRPKTSSFIDGDIYQLDSPLTLLTFPKLSLVDRLRTATALGLLRYNPIWSPLEKFRAQPYLRTVMGRRAYETIWKPLMDNKLGNYANEVSLAWFWARVKKRTSSLAYPEGGFLAFANALVEKIKEYDGTVFFGTEINEIQSDRKVDIKWKMLDGKWKIETFDKVVVTLPTFLFLRISPQLPNSYRNAATKLKGIGAINMVLRLKKQFLSDNTYWLNICDRKSPILAIVEHTNFMDKKNYNNEHLVYIGNYLPPTHPFFQNSKEDLLKIYDPFLQKINKNYKKNIIDYEVFKVPFAQPIVPTNYSKMIPKMTTPLANVFLANIEQVYPWDRGTNYAVELGEKVAKLTSNEK